MITLCFFFTVYNILKVGKQKSSIFVLFAELSNENIEEIIEDLLSINLREKKFDYTLKSLHKPTHSKKEDKNENIDQMPPQKISHQPNLTQENLLIATEPKETEIPAVESNTRDSEIKKKTKQNSLKHSDASLKKNSIIQVLISIIFITALFGLNIFLAVFNSNNYITLGSFNIILVQRHEDLTELNAIMFDALLFNNFEFLYPENPRGFDEIYEEIYSFEDKVLQFESNPPYMFKAFSPVALQFDSKDFCSVVSPYILDSFSKECTTKYGGILNQGLRNSIFYFLRALSNVERTFYNSDRSFAIREELLNGEELQNAVELKDHYLKGALLYLEDYFTSLSASFFQFAKTISAVKLSIIIIICIILYVLSYFFLLKKLLDEIWMTKGMLNLIPTALISSNKEIKMFFLNMKKK